jgi:hypothetical protein
MAVVPYATATTLLLRAMTDLLEAELEAELDATAANLGVTLSHPRAIERSYWADLRDVLPRIAVHAMERGPDLLDSAQRDDLRTTVRVFIVVGEADLGARDVSTYNDAMVAYLGAVSGLLQRRLPTVACDTAGVLRVDERTVRWEPAVDTKAGRWIQQGRLDLTCHQTVWWERPAVPPAPVVVYDEGVYEPGVYL